MPEKRSTFSGNIGIVEGAIGPLTTLPPIGGKSADVDGLLVVGDLKAQRSRAEIEYLRKYVKRKITRHLDRSQKPAHLDVARHAAGDDLLAVVGEGDAEHHLVVQVVEYKALKWFQAQFTSVSDTAHY